MKRSPGEYKYQKLLIIFLSLFVIGGCAEKKPAIVFQSDFGLKDGAVSAMKGVCLDVDNDLTLHDLTHEIPPYNIWEAAYRLQQTAPYWPEGTVFVSVVDPGVGTERRSVVLKSKSGHYFVGPDNGSFTLIAETLGIEEVREIDEELNRRKNSSESYTFHGRDVYAYTAARLASGIIDFEEVGSTLADSVVRLDYQQPLMQGDSIVGNIPILDIQYGNVWTNIGDTLFKKLNINAGDTLEISIHGSDSFLYRGAMPFVTTFGAVPEGKAMSYLNSLMNVSLAINMGSFADSFHIGSGPEWRVSLKKKNLGK
ncbi:MAG TPA: S-adenosyl-l-methionine hydroxide adenosyltransferase family protein [Flavitalea sp.]|nr:S-adenosyl-l-methionine hydroxide adenosyltransferase family protein [Flavitalea sp.]